MESPTLSTEDAEAVAMALRRLMAFLSEEQWAAGWFIEWEYKLWKDVLENRYEDADMLARLARLCNGWWRWRDETDPPSGVSKDDSRLVFVPMDEWRSRYDAWIAQRGQTGM